MDKPDLHEIAGRMEVLHEHLGGINEALDEAYQAALGESDPETDEEIEPGSGDEPSYFEQAKKGISDARMAVARAQATIAEAQGYRDFSESGAVPR